MYNDNDSDTNVIKHLLYDMLINYIYFYLEST